MVDCEQIRKRSLIDQYNKQFDREVNIMQNKSSDPHFHHEYRMPALSDHEFNRFVQADEFPASYSMAFQNEQEFNDINQINHHDRLHFAKQLSLLTNIRATDLPREIKPVLELKPILEKCGAWHRQMKDIAHGLESQLEETRTNATQSLSR